MESEKLEGNGDGEFNRMGIAPQQIEVENPDAIIFCPMTGKLVFQTLKAQCKIAQQSLRMLISSGSSHNLLEAKVVNKMQCREPSVKPFDVAVADVNQAMELQVYKQLTLSADLYAANYKKEQSELPQCHDEFSKMFSKSTSLFLALGNSLILLVVDRLSKIAYFIALHHLYFAASVSQQILKSKESFNSCKEEIKLFSAYLQQQKWQYNTSHHPAFQATPFYSAYGYPSSIQRPNYVGDPG